MNPAVIMIRKTLLLIVTMGTVTSAMANADLGPFEAIVKRNPFGLNPPKPVEPPPPPPPPPKSDVTLTGITSLIGGRPKAYLMTKDAKGTPEYHTLAINERSGSLEVLSIDSETGTVKIRNGSLESVLNFKDNGNKTAAVAPPPGAPGQPRPGGPPGVPTPVNVPAPNTGSPNAPANTSVQLGAPGQGGDGGNGRLLVLPTRTMRTSGSDSPDQNNVTVPHPPQANLSAEESAVIMAITKEAKKTEIQSGNFPPLPPVPGIDTQDQ